MSSEKPYAKDLAITYAVMENIAKTHIGLENLTIFDLLSEIANKPVLIIGCSGTGKSVCSDIVFDLSPRTKIKIGAMTISGLKKFQQTLSNNCVTIVVDDVSKGQTLYSEISTVSVFSSLCYTGEISKYTAQLDLNITNFRGSAIMNTQPILLKRLTTIPEFDADIRDKLIRYYHLYFPINPCLKRPQLYGVKIKYIEKPLEPKYTKYFDKALENFRYTHSKARAEQHLKDYISASALLNNRTEVTEGDEQFIYKLTRTFRLEPVIFEKKHLEGARYLHPDLLPLLSSFATFGKPNVKELMLRFGTSRQRTYEIIDELHEYAQLIRGKGIIIPTKHTIEIMKDIGVW